MVNELMGTNFCGSHVVNGTEHLRWYSVYICLTLQAAAMLSQYHNCDLTTIRRYHDAFDYDESDRNYDVFDSTAIRLRRKIDIFIFCSRRMETGTHDMS